MVRLIVWFSCAVCFWEFFLYTIVLNRHLFLKTCPHVYLKSDCFVWVSFLRRLIRRVLASELENTNIHRFYLPVPWSTIKKCFLYCKLITWDLINQIINYLYRSFFVDGKEWQCRKTRNKPFSHQKSLIELFLSSGSSNELLSGWLVKRCSSCPELLFCLWFIFIKFVIGVCIQNVVINFSKTRI